MRLITSTTSQTECACCGRRIHDGHDGACIVALRGALPVSKVVCSTTCGMKLAQRHERREAFITAVHHEPVLGF